MKHLKTLLINNSLIIKGLSANAIAQASVLCIQLLSLPLFLSVWSVEQYGQWLLIAAIPAYFSLGDSGVSSVAMNKMTMATAVGQPDKANQIFQNAFLALTAANIILLAASLVIANSSLLNLKTEHAISLVMLIAVATLNLYSGLVDGIFRSSDHYALGTNLLTLARFLEWTTGMTALFLTRTPVGCASGFIAGRVISLTLLIVISKRMAPNYAWRFKYDKEVFKNLFSHSRKYILLPISTSLSIQGVLIVISTTLGPAPTVIFSAYRTLSRITTQLIGAIGHTLWPQFSKLFALNNLAALNQKVKKWSIINTALAASISGAIYFFSDFILKHWTHGTIEPNRPLLVALLATSCIAAISNIFYTLCISTNSYGKLPIYYISSTFIMLCAMKFTLTTHGIISAALILATCELIILAAVRFQARKIIGKN